MPDWSTLASLATAAGTLVLAVATFAAIRSANRSARVAERAMLVGLRPMLVPSRLGDPAQKIYFGDGKRVLAQGGHACAVVDGDVVYLAASLRNAGPGIGVLRAWRLDVGRHHSEHHPALETFRQHTRDMYLPPSDMGFWQGALRDHAEPVHAEAVAAIKEREPLTVDLLYGDHEGGQRMISRFILQPRHSDADRDDSWLVMVTRHWNVDRPDPR